MTLLPGRTFGAIRTRAMMEHMNQPRASWSKKELSLMKRWYPDIALLRKKLPDRSYHAIKSRAQLLGIQREQKNWTKAEERRLALSAANLAPKEVPRSSPGRTERAVQARLRQLGIKVAAEPRSSKLDLLNELRRRCVSTGIPMSRIGKAVGSKSALKINTHRISKTLQASWVPTAFRLLGGELFIEWDD